LRWRKSISDVAARGEIIIFTRRDKNGDTYEVEKKNPYLLLAQESEKSMVAILDRLGLTPLNRSRVKDLLKDKSKQPPAVGSVEELLVAEIEEEIANGKRGNQTDA